MVVAQKPIIDVDQMAEQLVAAGLVSADLVEGYCYQWGKQRVDAADLIELFKHLHGDVTPTHFKVSNGRSILVVAQEPSGKLKRLPTSIGSNDGPEGSGKETSKIRGKGRGR